MRLNLIYARASNGVIGHHNALPWHLPEDMVHFKRQTLGCPVVMGRKTWDSLPPRFRPLPGRTNVVLTRDAGWTAAKPLPASGDDNSPQATRTRAECDVNCFDSLEKALKFLQNHPEVWVIGGAEVYALALPLAQRVVVTELDAAYEGDAFAPTLGSDWTESSREPHLASNGLGYSFVTYNRNEPQKV